MPFFRRRRGFRRRFRRRRFGATRRRRFRRSRPARPRYGRRQVLNVGRSFVPERALVNMKYCHRLNYFLTAANSHYQQAVFRADNIFDPYRTGTGHQPYGYDQWQTIYKYYTVLRSSISVKCSYTDNNYVEESNAHPAIYFGIACIEESQRAAYTALPLSAKQEHPLTVWREIGAPTSGFNTAMLRNHFNAYRRTGANPWTDTTQEKAMDGTPGTNLNQFYFLIWVANDVGGALEADSLTVQVTMNYRVLLRESVLPGQSLLDASELLNEQPGSPVVPPVSPGVDDDPLPAGV